MATIHKPSHQKSSVRKSRPIIRTNVVFPSPQSKKLRDLVSLYELLNLLADRVACEPDVYQKPFIDLICLCKLPLIKELSSDEQTFFNLCVDCLSQMGYLLRVQDQLIQRTICHTLDEFYDPIMLPQYNFEGMTHLYIITKQ
ncbi:unnamed protein product [Echinostoma caproni]|uniref:CCR4-NOT transcription complex subunit 11 n=1 Tax=Echinostoma caproni TaxID=27848 RepID=A0A183A1A1_9TREM|nr:unnamed protein product [Echinostoma caproni]